MAAGPIFEPRAPYRVAAARCGSAGTEGGSTSRRTLAARMRFSVFGAPATAV